MTKAGLFVFLFHGAILFIFNNIAQGKSSKVKSVGQETEVKGQKKPIFNDTDYDIGFKQLNQLFANPSNAYRIVYFHMGGAKVDSTTIDRFKNFGIGGLMQSVPFKSYLQDKQAWKELDTNVTKAADAGFKTWIWDECGYPSGAAGGLVVNGNPEYENSGIVRITRKGAGKETKRFQLPDSVNFFRATICLIVNGAIQPGRSKEVPLGKDYVETPGIKGDWQMSIFGTIILDKHTQGQETMAQFGHPGHYPNLLNKEAVQKFINLTHQQYADNISNMSSNVEIFYTGEPNFNSLYWTFDGSVAKYAHLPWEKDLNDKFKIQHGYSLLPYLDALFEGETPEAKTVRLNYYQTLADIFIANYAKPISDWCRLHGTKSLGHLLLEEHMAMHVINYGDLMKASAAFDVPALDFPVPKIDWKKWEFWMPKYISSAAYLENKSMVAGLIDPIVGGNGYGNLSPEISRMRRTVNMTFGCGINQLSSYIPFMNYPDGHYKAFSDYVGRLSVMLRGAKSEAPLAMYYPIETFQANFKASPEFWIPMAKSYEYLQNTQDRLCFDILRNGMDFNYLTARAIMDAKINNGCIEIGKYRYSAILMPKVEMISLDVLKKLNECSKAGIQVFWVDAKPTLGINNSEHNKVKKISASLVQNDNPIHILKTISAQRVGLEIRSSDKYITTTQYSRNGKRIYFIVNDSQEEINLDISVVKNNEKDIEIYDPNDGTIKKVSLPVSLKLGGFFGLFILQ
jgi:hypothetical protein